MKSSKNILRGLEISYSMAIILVLLLYSFVILAFTPGLGSSIHSGDDVNPLQEENYSVIIDHAEHGITDTLKGNLKNKKSMHFDSVNASHKHHNHQANRTMPVFSIGISKEKRMDIESWMLDSKFFGQPINCFKNELDKPLEIEKWMINSCHFGSSSDTVHDEALQIESWMTDNRIWGH